MRLGPVPCFELGRIVMTRGVDELVQAGVIENPWSFVLRHVAGDWAEMGNHDRRVDVNAAVNGGRVLSRFVVTPNVAIYVITEEDRSVTTLLLPSEY